MSPRCCPGDSPWATDDVSNMWQRQNWIKQKEIFQDSRVILFAVVERTSDTTSYLKGRVKIIVRTFSRVKRAYFPFFPFAFEAIIDIGFNNEHKNCRPMTIMSWRSQPGIERVVVKPPLFARAPRSSEPPPSCAPACLISWSAWKITSLGLFKHAWPQKAPSNPAACPQLIFLVATLLTAPPTDRVRSVLEEKGEGGLPGLALSQIAPGLGPMGRHSPSLSVPPPTRSLCDAWYDHFTSSVSCPLIKTPGPFTIWGCHTARAFYPTHRTSISWLPVSWSSPFFFLPSHLHSFTLANDPSRGKRHQQCLWEESMWNK